eukprot:7345337-Prymnesium_polylepis.1
MGSIPRYLPRLRELGVHPGNVLRTTTPGAQGKRASKFKTTKQGSEVAHIYSKSLGKATKTLRTAPKINRIGNFDPIYAADMAF